MNDFLSRLSPNDLPLLLTFGAMFPCVIVAIVATCVCVVRKTDNETKLKQDMLDRGMSAEEIKTVLEAGSKK